MVKNININIKINIKNSRCFLLLGFLGLYCSFVPYGLASWQMADPSHNTNLQPIFDYPTQYQSFIFLDLQKGSLYENIQRFTQNHHYQLIWQVKDRFFIVNKTTISGPNFQAVLEKLIHYYPELSLNYRKIPVINPENHQVVKIINQVVITQK